MNWRADFDGENIEVAATNGRVEKRLNRQLPTPSDLSALVETFDRHPVGALLLCLLLLVVILGVWVFRHSPNRQTTRTSVKRVNPKIVDS